MSATVPPFADTNVLLYLLSVDAAKADRAEALMAQRLTISVQVLNEFAHVARRKLALGWDEIVRLLADVQDCATVLPLTLETHHKALQLAERHQMPLYDALIAASALLAGCKLLYSEDMHHGLCIERSLKIRNPFLA